MKTANKDIFSPWISKIQNNIKLFNGLSKEEIVWVLSNGEMVSLKAQMPLIRSGFLESTFYVLLEGELSVNVPGKDNQIVEISIIDTVCTIGEIGAVLYQKRTAHVQTKSAAKLIRLNKSMFLDAESKKPQLAIKLYKNVIDIIANDYLKPQIFHEQINQE